MESKKNSKSTNRKSSSREAKHSRVKRFSSFLSQDEKKWYSVNYLLAQAHKKGRSQRNVTIHSLVHDNTDFHPMQYYKNISTMWKLKSSEDHDAPKQ